jgi:hypothetical protein
MPSGDAESQRPLSTDRVDLSGKSVIYRYAVAQQARPDFLTPAAGQARSLAAGDGVGHDREA